MKAFYQFIEEAATKRCKVGYYYCFTDKKCKKIPGGYHVGRGGYLEKDNVEMIDDGTKAIFDGPFTLPILRRNEAMYLVNFK